jgi:heat shock protein HtpX
MVLQFAVSRTRESKADATGAEISGRPPALASALQKLKASARRVPMMIPPSVGAVVQVAPLPALGGGVAKLFSTHPATAARMERLQQIATKMDKG